MLETSKDTLHIHFGRTMVCSISLNHKLELLTGKGEGFLKVQKFGDFWVNLVEIRVQKVFWLCHSVLIGLSPVNVKVKYVVSEM